MEYGTYSQRNVGRLSTEEGRALLRNLGVRGPDHLLDQIVEEWDGYPLVLGLLGAYAAQRYEGDVKSITETGVREIPDAPLYERMTHILRWYDEQLTHEERSFLIQLSAFRLPSSEEAIERVMQAPMVPSTNLSRPLAELDAEAFERLLRRLIASGIVRHDPEMRWYTLHPLIRAHYLDCLDTYDHTEVQALHRRIASYYLSLSNYDVLRPTLREMSPLVETVHHLCRAGDYRQALMILGQRILFHGEGTIFIHELGAVETELDLLAEFFPSGDFSQAPVVTDPYPRYWLLNEAGVALASIGRLTEALPLYERAIEFAASGEFWSDVSVSYENISSLQAFLGNINASRQNADEALAAGRRSRPDIREERVRNALVRQAWVAYLRGRMDTAGSLFQEAERLERDLHRTLNEYLRHQHRTEDEFASDSPLQITHLYALNGVQHVDYLRKVGDIAYARRVAEANLNVSQAMGLRPLLGLAHRVMGDLDLDSGHYESALQHYNYAVRIGRSVPRRDVRIEALLARGHYWLEPQDLDAARNDLYESLDDALSGGYRIYEIDIRLNLAQAQLAMGDLSTARAEVAHARYMASDIGYYWGLLNATQMQATLDKP